MLMLRRYIALITVLVVAGCAGTSTTVRQIDRLDTMDKEHPRLLVMPPDVRYYLLTTGGVPQPHSAWTDAARSNFETALVAFARRRNTELVRVPLDTPLGETEVAYQKLYSAVGMTIMANYYGGLKLPTKLNSFEWSLGPGVQALANKYDADYALFSYYRDHQASTGRLAFAVMAGLAGVDVTLGSEGGFAALVDLHSGDIVWFNRVLAGSGELRDASGAHSAVRTLFKDLPGG